MTVWSDCLFVVNGFNDQRRRLEVCKFFSLWQRIFACVEGRNVQVRWIKAHITRKHLDTGAVEAWQALGNEVVDGLAKSAPFF